MFDYVFTSTKNKLLCKLFYIWLSNQVLKTSMGTSWTFQVFNWLLNTVFPSQSSDHGTNKNLRDQRTSENRSYRPVYMRMINNTAILLTSWSRDSSVTVQFAAPINLHRHRSCLSLEMESNHSRVISEYKQYKVYPRQSREFLTKFILRLHFTLNPRNF